MKKLLLLFHTVKCLKWPQFYFRFYRKFFKPKVTEQFNQYVVKRSHLWKSVELFEEKITFDYRATFLNHSKTLNFPVDWNDESHSKLWTYNLHYFEELLSINSDQKRDFHSELIEQWIQDNPIGKGNGWEPYPISLRVPNIFKAWLSGMELTPSMFESLHAQASYLSNDLEKHLLGNHYFVNLKALLFAGVIFKNSRWLNIAEKGLLKEIPEQILDDGFNFELTPMYHSLILVDMLDMCNLCRSYPESVSSELSRLIEKYIPKMLHCMEAISHPDGGVSFFNDSVDGIAPQQALIKNYAKGLGFQSENFNLENAQVFDLKHSGYLVATLKGLKVIFDASNVGPDYIPGHAHADTLSFEMSIGPERVFVNTGISQYGLSPQRLIERKTISHNTIEVDNKDSSQVWSGFRVAKRARINWRYAEIKGDGVILSASHNGYENIIGGCEHARTIELGTNSFVISDKIKGQFNTAISRLYFHPDLSVTLSEGMLAVEGQHFSMRCDLSSLDVCLKESLWHPEFGLSRANKVLETKMETDALSLNFLWNKK
ncbi:hypothetical protein D5018_06980 [Parashewanella curva]|uniref:Uncharacterized protein n=1 Tax=Parashewanella curva TaxID=2338552 RepID=A0A3L8PYN4_9GAMM|nr:heparinase II/III family protein [Parashewanella curva]RLV60395.1 hypothetical protein D5018_06980 [Parashewanella curva]